jgi:acyl-CoA synthetase (NDP forming)
MTRLDPASDLSTDATGNLPLERLFKPRSLAVIGASTREDAIGFRVIRNMRGLGFDGDIYPINPRYEAVAGLPCFPNLGALPGPVDAAFIALPAEQGPSMLEEVARSGIKAAFVNASGYADGGPAGRALQRRLQDVAHAHGIALAGPNNMGLINVNDRVAIWTQLHMTALRPGPIAVIAQSGSVALVLAQDERRLGLAYLVTAGNEAVLGVAQYLDHIVRDPRVKTILVFVESIRDPERFAAAAATAHAHDKRIVALKTGASPRGTALVAAHTDSLAGDDAVYDAYFARHGIIRVRDLDEMLETAVLVTAYPAPPRTRHFVPVTLSGGEAALIADLADEVGLDLQPLSEATLARLRPAFPPFAHPQNPLDGWGLGFNGERFGEMLAALQADAEIGAIGLSIDCPAAGGGDLVYAREMARLCVEAAWQGKPTVFFNNTTGTGPNAEVKAMLDQAGIPYLAGMRTALAAVANWIRSDRPPTHAGMPDDDRAAAWRSSLAAGVALNETSLFELLGEAGVPMVPCRLARSAEGAVACAEALGYPVVLKGAGAGIAHKTELDLVRLGLDSPSAVRAAYGTLDETLRRHLPAGEKGEILVQPMLGSGIELILGLRNDPAFGTVLVVGLGGIFVEFIKSVSLRLAPVDTATAREMLAECRAAELLGGLRGRGPYDIFAAAEAIAALSRFGAATRSAVGGLEINPLIVLEHGAFGVDALVQPLPGDIPAPGS